MLHTVDCKAVLDLLNLCCRITNPILTIFKLNQFQIVCARFCTAKVLDFSYTCCVAQGCLNGRPKVNFSCLDVRFVRTAVNIVRTSAHVRVYPVDAVLPADGILPSVPTIKTASARARVPTGPGPHRPAPGRTRKDIRRADAALGGQLGFCI
jgi:hypothetical protein